MNQLDPRIDELLRQVRELSHQRSLRKNGESWPAYVGKIVTPERVMLAVMLIWQFGGEWRDLKVKVDENIAAVQHKADQVDALAESVRLREETAKQLSIDTKATTDDLKAEMVSLTERVNRTITRAEFNAAINNGVVPRLASIEKQLKSAAVYSGEQRR